MKLRIRLCRHAKTLHIVKLSQISHKTFYYKNREKPQFSRKNFSIFVIFTQKPLTENL